MKKKLFIVSALFIANLTFAQSWKLTGNSGTNPNSDYVGTTDGTDFVIGTSNKERLRVAANGSIGVRTAPDPNIAFKVAGRTQVVCETNDDTFYIGNNNPNNGTGVSLLFLRYTQYQPLNPGVLDVSGMTSPTQYEQFFTLKANGKLGLGTINVDCPECTGYRLFVKEGIKTEKIKVEFANQHGWADYVFEKDYELMDLKKLETFVTENKHLPEVPTAEEVVANGLELKEFNALLLKKVEELTLYVIQLNKDLEASNVKIKNLENNTSKQ